MLTFITSETDITIYSQEHNEQVSISRKHPSIGAIKKAIKENDFNTIKSFVNCVDSINNNFKKYTTDVEFKNNIVYYKGQEINNELTRMIIDLYSEGFDVKSYLNFLDKVMKNPSYNSREQLFKFISAHKLPITEDGDILGYKGVTKDYKDCHTRKFDNSIGARNKMDRSLVDDNPNNDCSQGFHVGSETYARGFGDVTVIVKVNPKDAVSVPNHDTNKLRVCEYEVVAQYNKELKKSLYNNDSSEIKTKEIDVDSLLISDEIVFNYKSKSRHIIITNLSDDQVTGLIQPLDCSWNGTNEYRIFNLDDMTDVYLCNDEDDEDDEDENDF